MPAERIAHTHIGGQAVLEGVMMRGKYNWGIAVRRGDGSIHVEQHELAGARKGWMRWPVVRGVVTMVDTIVLAMQAFSISAAQAGEGLLGEEEEPLTKREISISLGIGLVLAVGLFILLPAGVTQLLTRFFGKSNFLWNLIDGLIRIAVFFLYIWAVSRMKDIQRLFAYHGAEHKTIHAYEHGRPLETESIQEFETMHVRCGTSFLLMVMIIAILVYSVIPVFTFAGPFGWGLSLGWRVGIRLLLLPVIAGLAYEVIKFAGNHTSNPVVKALLWPGLMLQKMTTREPDDSMVEVAVMAVRPVLEREEVGAALPEGDWMPPEERIEERQGPADVVPDRELEPPGSGEPHSVPQAQPGYAEPLTSTGEVRPADA
jgi:uncharacterized protein YqhQ